MEGNVRRPISWYSNSVLVALLLMASPGLAQAQEQDDPFVGTVARLESASARLDDRASPPQGEELARLASEAIQSAYFSERYAKADALYSRYKSLDLTALARAAGLGALLQVSTDDQAKGAARTELAGISEQAPMGASLAPALSQAALGADAMLRDDLAAAVIHFRKAMELAERDLAADDPAQVIFAVNYARHLQYSDRTEGRKAAERSEQLALAILPEGHPHWIAVWYDMAARAQAQARFDEAASLYARITDLAVRDWGADDRRLYPIFQYRAIALSGLARRREALELARRAVELEGDRPAGDRAMHRELIGGLLMGEGQIEQAAASYREGLELLAGTDSGDLRWAFIQSRLARALSMMGDDAEAVRLANIALKGFAAKLPPTHPGRLETEAMIARIYARAGLADRAYALLANTVTANEAKLLDSYARTQNLGVISAGNNSLFRDFAWVALQNDRQEEAWRAAQLATLGQLALASAQLSYPGDAAGLTRALDCVRAARSAETRVREALASGATQNAELAAAITERESAERALDMAFPDHAQYLRPAPATLAQAQAALGADDAAILPLVVEDRNVTLVLTREGLAWGDTISPYNSTPGLIQNLRNSLEETAIADGKSGGFDHAAAHEIYRRFFPQRVLQAMAGKKRLIFPAGGPLAQIPPSVLLSVPFGARTKARYLIEDYAIAVRSSLYSRRSGTQPAAQGFAGIGAPQLAAARPGGASLRGMTVDTADLRALPSLPGSMKELLAMREALRENATLLLTGAEATEPNVRNAPLGDYRVLAFSTHGLVGGQIASLNEAALVLTPPDQATAQDDGLLTASEIASLDLAADWVILSACSTAAGNAKGSPSYGGLARAFQSAGARSLLLSHWPVRDDAAAFLSVETLRLAGQGEDRAEALRAAQLRMIGSKTRIPGQQRPDLWAPFILIEG